MKVVMDGGAVVEIGATEAAPTIGIIDYSRRETDDFGVTTVVQRGFARQMSVRVKLATTDVDAVQRQLAALRATPALWVADDDLDSLSIEGFFKDFSIDLAIPPVSYCTLTIEGLAGDVVFADPATDPAPDGRASSLRLLQPAAITDAVLSGSSIAENDHPGWAVGTTYPLGARVIKVATHRVYESVAAGNVGNDPAGASGLWLDVGPTNRCAMFDQALGSVSEAAGSIVVTLDPVAAVNAVALLDVTAATVRVQAAGYDQTKAPAVSPGMVTFLDVPPTSGAITVTISGSGTVSVGTLLMGVLLGLGVTESSPTAAITDYSRKEVDDFGDVTLVERAWAKRMSVRGLIATNAVDVVMGRMGNARAIPALWIGDDGLEAVTVYGFFKDFSIEVGEHVSTLSLSVEGLSAAAKITPILSDVSWVDLVDDDPSRPKPQDGATVGAPAGTMVGNKSVEALLNQLSSAQIMAAVGEYYAKRMETVDPESGLVAITEYANADGIVVARTMGAGPAGGFVGYMASNYLFTDNSGGNARPIMEYSNEAGRWRIWNAWINELEIGSVLTGSIAVNAVVDGDTIALASPLSGNGSWQTAVNYVLDIPAAIEGEVVDWQVVAIVTGAQGFPSGDRTWNTRLLFDSDQKGAAGGQKSEDSLAMSGRANWGPGTHNIKVEWNGQSTVSLSEMNMTLLWFKR